MTPQKLADLASGGLHRRIADDVPALKRGLVWCRVCGREQKVDSADCLARGWPTCHGQTMTLDPPEMWEDRP